MTNLDSIFKKQRHHFVNKGLYNQSYGFSISHIWMWVLDHKESWALKNWYFWTLVLEKTLESPRDCKEIQPVHPKGNESWVFIGRTDAEAEAPILWPPDVENWLIRKDSDAGKGWRQEEKGTTGWGGWMASVTRWTWVWASPGSWWWTGKPGALQSMGSQRVRHNWATELNLSLNWLELLSSQLHERSICWALCRGQGPVDAIHGPLWPSSHLARLVMMSYFIDDFFEVVVSGHKIKLVRRHYPAVGATLLPHVQAHRIRGVPS